MKRYLGYVGIRLGVTALVVGSLYIGLVFLPHARNNRPPENASITKLRTYATESLLLISSIRTITNEQAENGYELSTALAAYVSHTPQLSEISTSKLPEDTQTLVKDTLNVQDTFAHSHLAAAGRYTKILGYYPESDLYGPNVSEDTAKARSGDAVNSLRAMIPESQNSSVASPLEKTADCLEQLQVTFRRDACLRQYAALRKAAIGEVSILFSDTTVAPLKKSLQALQVI